VARIEQSWRTVDDQPSPAAAGGSPRVAILNFVIENVISCKNRKKLLKFDHSSSFPLMVPWGKAVTVFIS